MGHRSIHDQGAARYQKNRATSLCNFLCIRASITSGKPHTYTHSLKHETNALFHKLLMFATYRLCEHPEYVKPLLAEAEAMLKLPEADHYKNVPLMESFLREAARHDPLDSRKLPSPPPLSRRET